MAEIHPVDPTDCWNTSSKNYIDIQIYDNESRIKLKPAEKYIY